VANLEQEREKRARYRETHKEYNKQYREEHKEEIKIKQKEWREQNKEQIALKAKEFREAHQEEIKLKAKEKYQRNKDKQKSHQLQMMYGISLAQLEDMILSQNSKCAICGKELTIQKGGYVVDHDHTTGKVRGILCPQCNFLLGNAQDNLDIMKGAIKYLEGGR